MSDALIDFVRHHDPDRFLTALFAPPAKRGALLTLYAFNHELARAREAVTEPALAIIRLHWWREVVEGAEKRHEVATQLTAAIRAGDLAPADLLALIDAREIEADPSIPTLADWRVYINGNAGGLAVAAGRLLGAPEPESLRPLGAAYGVAGLLRSVPALACQGRCLLPDDLLAAQGLTAEEVILHPDAAAPVMASLLMEGNVLLQKGRGLRLPRSAIAAALPAVLARRDMARLSTPVQGRGVADRLAVMLTAITGRI